MIEHIISNVSDLIKILNKLGIPDIGKTRFFRGQANKDWIIEPSIFRNKKLIENEHRIIKDLLTNCPDDFSPNDTLFEKLVKLQHYGCKTRLLDLTSNALVALYFSCVEKSHHHKDGELIILDIPNEHIKYSDSDTVSILTAISVQPSNFNIKGCVSNASRHKRLKELSYIASQHKNINDFEESHVGQLLNITKSDYENLVAAGLIGAGQDAFLNSFNEQKEIVALIHDIRADKPSFQPVINSEDLNRILCVKAKLNNARITRQQGCFLLYGMNEDKLSHPPIPEEWFRKAEKQKFIVRNKENILKELELFGVSTQILFPELEKQAIEFVSRYT